MRKHDHASKKLLLTANLVRVLRPTAIGTVAGGTAGPDSSARTACRQSVPGETI
jgi:hypothetical protein